MSAVAMPFDPTFTMGPRPTFTWPGPLESGSTSSNSILGTDLSSIISGSEPSLTPPSETKSLASSPPRTTMTPELQELKRQRDRVRRDSKISARLQRAESSSYTTSPPMAMGEVSNAIDLPVYTTAPSSMPLMTAPAATLGGPSFLQHYNPSLTDHQPGSQVFQPAYQSLHHGYGVAMEYQQNYTNEYTPRASSISVPQDAGIMYPMQPVPAPATNPTAAQEGGHVRVVQSRPKPRCWEHGCNGRQFSTFSNLLRHQREKSGQAAKASCPNCGAEFTRTTARNGHLLHDKCKQRRKS